MIWAKIPCIKVKASFCEDETTEMSSSFRRNDIMKTVL